MKKKIERFEDLEIWQKAAAIAVDTFKICDEQKQLKNDWGTKDQIQRAAFSISNNIAEGFEYNNNNDFIKFLRYAKGSAGEGRSKLYVLKEAGKIPPSYYEEKQQELLELGKQIGGFIKYLKNYKINNS